MCEPVSLATNARGVCAEINQFAREAACCFLGLFDFPPFAPMVARYSLTAFLFFIFLFVSVKTALAINNLLHFLGAPAVVCEAVRSRSEAL